MDIILLLGTKLVINVVGYPKFNQKLYIFYYPPFYKTYEYYDTA